MKNNKRIKFLNIFLIFVFINVVLYSYELSYTQKMFKEDMPKLLTDLSNLLCSLNNVNYFRGMQISELSKKGVCRLPILIPWNEEAKKLLKEIPRYDDCKKNSPLSFIKEKRLFIDQNINITYYSGKISHCQYAKVIGTAVDKEYYKLCNYFKNFY